jgi:Arc/MetJ-type ribon-helix-helix transcriptional regulator
MVDRISVSFDPEDIEILTQQVTTKKYDSYAAAIRAAVRITFGNQKEVLV